LGEFVSADDLRDEALNIFDNEDIRIIRTPNGAELIAAARKARLGVSRAGSPSRSQLSQMLNEMEGRQRGPSGLSRMETQSQIAARQRQERNAFGDISSSSAPRSYDEAMNIPEFKGKLMTLRDDNNN
jgi:hypothetical protein